MDQSGYQGWYSWLSTSNCLERSLCVCACVTRLFRVLTRRWNQPGQSDSEPDNRIRKMGFGLDSRIWKTGFGSDSRIRKTGFHKRERERERLGVGSETTSPKIKAKVTRTHGGVHSGLRPWAPTSLIYKFT